jgi:carbon monoxide dehydrogenase subunit G
VRIEQSFTVAVPVAEVWSALIDVERVAPCLPGAEITGSDDGAFHGLFTVKIGPTTAKYRGTLEMQNVDEAARTARMKARGSDTRGQGGASAEIASTLSEEGDGTRIDVVTDLTISGRLARFGRGGMIEDISQQLMAEFATCLQASLTAAGAREAGQAEPVKGIRLVLRALAARLRGVIRRASGLRGGDREP